MFIITSVELNCELKALTFYIYTWFSFNIVFIQNNIVIFYDRQFSMFHKHFKLIESISQLDIVYSYRKFVV